MIQQGVADRLRAGGHLDEVAVSGLLEGGDLRGRGAFLGGVRRHGPPSAGTSRFVWMPIRPFGFLAAHRVGDAGAHVAALGHVAGVAEAVA